MLINVRRSLYLSLLLAALGLLAVGCSSSDDGGNPVTPPTPDTTPPGEVSSFLALPGDGQATLSWILPQSLDLAGVMIRRAENAAPTRGTGEAVYSGMGGVFTDQAVTNDTSYFYTAFTFDADSNYSAGVSQTCTPHVANTVVIPDANLQLLIRTELGIPAGDITDLEMMTLTHLDASSQGIADLQGLQYCQNLTDLSLRSNGLTDAGNLQVLAQLIRLEGLDLGGNVFTILPNLSTLTSLWHLNLDEVPITSLEPLSHVTSLGELQFMNCHVSDLTPLENMVNLEYLLFRQTDVTSLDGLAGLTNLKILSIAFCDITDLTPLSGLTSLETLGIIGAQIGSLTPLSGLSSLTVLSLGNDGIVDLTGLGSLNQLKVLTLSINQITDLSPLAGLSNLANLMVGSNLLRSIPDLSSLTHLESLSAQDNELSNIAPLTALPALQNVDLSNNPLTTADVQTVLPQLKAGGVTVTFTYDADLVELMGPWTIAEVNLDGTITAPAVFFEWAPGVVRNRFAFYPFGAYASEDLDASGSVLYHETGSIAVVGNNLTLTVLTEDGSPADPTYVAFDGTWAKVAGNLVFSGTEGGAPFALTWSR